MLRPHSLCWILLIAAACEPGARPACTGTCAETPRTLPDSCDPAAVDACGDTDFFCDATSHRCARCATDLYNCDGIDECESVASCDTGQLRGKGVADGGADAQAPDPTCDPLASGICGGATRFCQVASGNCGACAAGTRNCDGIGACEPCETGACENGLCKEPPPPSNLDCAEVADCVEACGANETCALACREASCASAKPILDQILVCAAINLCVPCLDGLTKSCLACVKSACTKDYNTCLAHAC